VRATLRKRFGLRIADLRKASGLSQEAAHTPGVYLPTVRIHDDTDNPGLEDGLENLAPVIVIVQ
jgi:hypothetical protein